MRPWAHEGCVGLWSRTGDTDALLLAAERDTAWGSVPWVGLGGRWSKWLWLFEVHFVLM